MTSPTAFVIIPPSPGLRASPAQCAIQAVDVRAWPREENSPPHRSTSVKPEPNFGSRNDTGLNGLEYLFALILSSKETASALPAARKIPNASAFLDTLADHLAGTSRGSRDRYVVFVGSLASRLPTDAVSRRALEMLVRDLIWEIDQPQAS